MIFIINEYDFRQNSCQQLILRNILNIELIISHYYEGYSVVLLLANETLFEYIYFVIMYVISMVFARIQDKDETLFWSYINFKHVRLK